ncbi:MAG: GNAT family N-acetyltransferase, partial [Actinobacteria bacterium]|nr:GNAT family N-acetyltransferase [Actinomycetota bacterium]
MQSAVGRHGHQCPHAVPLELVAEPVPDLGLRTGHGQHRPQVADIHLRSPVGGGPGLALACPTSRLEEPSAVHDGLVLRPVRDDDGPRLVALIGAAYAEYPGCVLDLPDLDADLPVPETTAARRGGRWWVIEDADRIVASVGTGAPDDGAVELKRLYVAASHRRRGLAAALVERVEAQAAGIGCGTVVLWSDT